MVAYLSTFTAGTLAVSVSHTFEEFKETCSKTYGTRSEELHAKECWKTNTDEIVRLNSASKYANFAENCETDMCSADRVSGLGPIRYGAHFGRHCDVMEAGDESQYVDWEERGAVSHVKNQGQCGSCWSFATTGAIESALLLRGMNVSLSEAELISCSPHGPSCEGWWPKEALDWIITNNSGALATEANYPYPDISVEMQWPEASCNTSALSDHGYSPFTMTNLTSYGTDQKSLLHALQNEGPVAVAVWGGSTGFRSYKGGFVMTADQCQDDGTGADAGYDHEVLLVGYGYDSEQGLPYWRIKNSWGVADWGEQGYARIAYADGACGISSPRQPGGSGSEGCVYVPRFSGPSTQVTTTTLTTPMPPSTTTAPHHDCSEVQSENGQHMLWVPGCTGAGCFANGKDRNCAWCVYDLNKCEAQYGSACKDVQEAREKDGVSCSPEIISV